MRRACVPLAGGLALLAAATLATAAPAAVSTTESSRPVVTVNGDAAADSIRIECVQDLLKVNGVDPPGGPASCSDLIELHVNGGGGDDTLDLRPIDAGLVALHEKDPAPQVTVAGGEGDDRLLDGAGVESANGGPGADTLIGRGLITLLNGGPGPDRMIGGNGLDFISSGSGDDTVTGNGAGDFIATGAGADLVHGGDAGDLVIAGGGADRVYGGQGGDSLAGGPGPDLLRGGPDKDKLFGGPGKDRLRGGRGDDRINQNGSDLAALLGFGPGGGSDSLISKARATWGHSIVGSE